MFINFPKSTLFLHLFFLTSSSRTTVTWLQRFPPQEEHYGRLLSSTEYSGMDNLAVCKDWCEGHASCNAVLVSPVNGTCTYYAEYECSQHENFNTFQNTFWYFIFERSNCPDGCHDWDDYCDIPLVQNHCDSRAYHFATVCQRTCGTCTDSPSLNPSRSPSLSPSLLPTTVESSAGSSMEKQVQTSETRHIYHSLEVIAALFVCACVVPLCIGFYYHCRKVNALQEQIEDIHKAFGLGQEIHNVVVDKGEVSPFSGSASLIMNVELDDDEKEIVEWPNRRASAPFPFTAQVEGSPRTTLFGPDPADSGEIHDPREDELYGGTRIPRSHTIDVMPPRTRMPRSNTIDMPRSLPTRIPVRCRQLTEYWWWCKIYFFKHDLGVFHRRWTWFCKKLKTEWFGNNLLSPFI